MAVVAGLFDSQADADLVMNNLHRMNIEGLETRVYNGGESNAGDVRPAVVIPVVPNTGIGPGSTMDNNMGIGGAAVVPGNAGWLDKFEEEERAFYLEGVKEGATFVYVSVPDDHAEHVRLEMSKANARTYVKD